MKKVKTKKSPFLAALAHGVEWLAVALVFAFVFRGFVVEAFKIPTGSMAPTLRGDHFGVVCVQCGYQYDVNRSEGFDQQIASVKFKCPSCGHHENLFVNHTGGDRILVYKGLYNFKDPKRWDVFVFKNPTEPHINYIKRAIGLPNETLEMIDGDIFIDGKIARKPPKVQDSLWMPVYNGDFIPARPGAGGFARGGNWRPPFIAQDGWSFEDNGATLTLNNKREKSTLMYDPTIGNDFRATYGYNAPVHDNFQEIVSDFRVNFWVDGISSGQKVGAIISKYGRDYIATADLEKSVIALYREHEGNIELLESLDISRDYPKEPIFFSFNNADYRLSFTFGRYNISKILGERFGDIGTYHDGEPAVGIIGKGKFSIQHFSLYRDMHYCSRGIIGADEIRGGEGNPITLGEDEFFACGDNSPQSLDSRLWTDEGLGNHGKTYPAGIVPRDYLIGEAFFVYWPGSYQRDPRSSTGMIPNVGLMRWIYGGSNRDEKKFR